MIGVRFSVAEKAILVFTVLYLAIFTVLFIRDFNVEFIAYVAAIIFIFALLFSTLNKTNIPAPILAGLSLWGLMHMLGGSMPTADGVLYDWKMLPLFDAGEGLTILKFDQFVHGYLYAVVALLFLHLLRNYFANRHSQILIGFIAVSASMGVGAVNEIIEFIAVLTVPDNNVGGYNNTALDIVFNFIGALMAVLIFYLVNKIKRVCR